MTVLDVKSVEQFVLQNFSPSPDSIVDLKKFSRRVVPTKKDTSGPALASWQLPDRTLMQTELFRVARWDRCWVRRACQRCCTTKNLQQGKGQTKGVEATAGACGFWSIYKVPNTPSKLG
uniref:(northern house mosquito) hypothetical protein n=1 Tax=Culex pipiens TaxID=7175 RepID=A0A8D8LBN2_CULPI